MSMSVEQEARNKIAADLPGTLAESEAKIVTKADWYIFSTNY